MECVFCEIVKKRRDAYIIYEDEYHLSFLDRYPVVRGHTLVIPKEHHDTINHMKRESVGELFSLVPLIASAVLEATGTADYNVGQNNGHAAKQVVPHVHVHIIPRRPHDHINWSSRLLPSREEFQELAHCLRSIMSSRS